MSARKATDIFSEWALNGKDLGMQDHHSTAVDAMLETLTSSRSSSFSFVDAGCGNGWVVRKMSSTPQCTRSFGIDGAEEMIRKAKMIDPKGNYIHSDLLTWVPHEAFDIVHSMEVFYYFKDPEELIKHIMDNWLKPYGQMIMGVDHYHENIKSHSWPTDLNTYMKLLSIDDWVELFKDCGLEEVKAFQANAKDDFPGTLIVHGLKGRGS